MGLTDEVIVRRKNWLQFASEDEERLRDLDGLAQNYSDSVIEELYENILATPEGRAFFHSPEILEKVKRMQNAYFRELTLGEYDAEYVEKRLKVGIIHERIGLDPRLYLAAYNFYMKAVGRRIVEAYKDLSKAMATYESLKKLIFLDIGLTSDAYLYARER
ncbi:MAG: transcriptional regulator, partial [Gemmataceae bacterium]|nr:transcriptional regulator [Gemmataceae bacterium]